MMLWSRKQRTSLKLQRTPSAYVELDLSFRWVGVEFKRDSLSLRAAFYISL
jgi:hypothetical protein